MADKIRIVTDSSADLSRELLEAFEIEVVPLSVLFGTDIYDDGTLSAEEFWAKASGAHHPRTSQPPIGAFQDVFERLVAGGRQVLCLTVTSKHSGTFSAARMAAQSFGQAVQVFDSYSVSSGLAFLAMTAAKAAEAGRNMQEIVGLLEDIRARLRLVIVLDTLENLRRGGRADTFISVADRMARALNIKVIVNMVEGQLRLLTAARSYKRALASILDMVEQLGPLDFLAVGHTRNLETAKQVAEQLAQRTGVLKERIAVQETGAVISSHAGPRIIGIFALPARATSQP
jgi:DegV family protein with EDD domain